MVKNSTLVWTGIGSTLLGGVLVLGTMGATGNLSVGGKDVVQPGDTPEEPVVNVDLQATGALTLDVNEKYNEGTDVSAVCTFIAHNDGASLSDADCSSVSIKSRIPYTVLVNATGYSTEKIEINWNGVDALKDQKVLLGDIIDLSSAITFYNKDASTNINTSQYAITDSTKNIDFDIDFSNEDVYEGGIIVFEAVKTNYSAVSMSVNGKVLPTATAPEQFTSSSTGVKTYIFELPEINMESAGTTQLKGTVTVTPDEDEANASQDITYTIYDKAYYVDSDTSSVEGRAVEDSKDNDVGIAQVTGTIYLS